MSLEDVDRKQDGERRSAPRFATEIAGRLGPEGEHPPVKVVNLSTVGALAISEIPFKDDGSLATSLHIALDGETPEEILAAVVRCTPRPDGRYDLGLWFLGVTAHQQELIEHACAHSPSLNGAC